MSDSEHASMPGLASTPSCAEHVAATNTDIDFESECESDGYGELFGPLSVNEMDPMQMNLASLEHAPQQGRKFLSELHGG